MTPPIGRPTTPRATPPAAQLLPQRRGFTAVEVLTALVLFAIVGLGMLGTLMHIERTSNAQMAAVRLDAQTRDAGSLVSTALRDADAADLDIVSMSSQSLTVKATRQVGFVCDTPSSPYTSVVIAATRSYGARWFDPTRDSLVVYADGDTTTTADDRWLRASLGAATLGSGTCSDGSSPATLGLTVASAGGDTDLKAVYVGAPVRSFELDQLSLVLGTDGRWYLGMSHLENGAWTAPDLVAGPFLGTSGIAMTYYDTAGVVTTTPANVSSVGIAVRGLSTTSATLAGRIGTTQQDSVITLVTLRNNPH